MSSVQFASQNGLAVLNPGGRDLDLSYGSGVDSVDAPVHPPVNYHAYAACTGGGFYRTTSLAARHRSVLLLLRGSLRGAERAFLALKARGCFVAIALKETGVQQLAEQLQRPGWLRKFQQLASAADLGLASTPDAVPLYQAWSRKVVYLPTPYPVDLPNWRSLRAGLPREGIFIGTREISVLARNHVLALAALRTSSQPITVLSDGTKAERRILDDLRFPPDQLKTFPQVPYPDYLVILRRHRLVFQLDSSRVPGQVAGDAVLTGTPVVGGEGAIEREIFPDLTSFGRSFPEVLTIAIRLLRDPVFYGEQVDKLNERAQSRISFSAIRRELLSWFPGA